MTGEIISTAFAHDWHGSMGKGSGYLICSLFFDFIFLLGLDNGDGKPVNGSVRLGFFLLLKNI